MSLRMKFSKVLAKFSKPYEINGEYLVDSKTINKIPIKKLGLSPKVTEAILICPENISLGNNVVLNFHVWLNGVGGLDIGDDVSIGPFTLVHSSNHKFDRIDMKINKQGHENKRIIIESDVWIGGHCLILPGSHIEKGCVIGAGAIITKRIPEYSVVINRNEIIKQRG